MAKGSACAGALIGATMLLAACAERSWVPEGPRDYQLGYIDGCYQGYTDGGWQMNIPTDEEKLDTDAVYRKGWEAGHAKCYAEQIRTPRYNNGGAGMP